MYLANWILHLHLVHQLFLQYPWRRVHLKFEPHGLSLPDSSLELVDSSLVVSWINIYSLIIHFQPNNCQDSPSSGSWPGSFLFSPRLIEWYIVNIQFVACSLYHHLILKYINFCYHQVIRYSDITGFSTQIVHSQSWKLNNHFLGRDTPAISSVSTPISS